MYWILVVDHLMATCHRQSTKKCYGDDYVKVLEVGLRLHIEDPVVNLVLRAENEHAVDPVESLA